MKSHVPSAETILPSYMTFLHFLGFEKLVEENKEKKEGILHRTPFA